MEFFKALDLIIVSQLIVFIVFISKQKQLTKANKIYLLIYVSAILWCLIDRILFFYRDFLNANNLPHFYHSSDPFKYVFFPSIYLYIKSITNYNFKFKWLQLWHLTPFAITLTYLLSNYTFLPVETKFQALSEGGTSIYKPIYLVHIFSIIYELQKLYILAALLLVINYQRKLKKFVSNLYWYNTIPLYLILITFIIIHIIRYHFFHNLSIDIDFTFYAIIIVFVGYKQRHFFISPPVLFKKHTDDNPNKELKLKIESFMCKHKPYLNPDITLEKLAVELNIPTRKFSNVLNNEFKANFFNFINDYRINEAKNILVDNNQKQKTVLEILYEVGFNNKSAFNRVFKDATGLTPTNYRKQKLQK